MPDTVAVTIEVEPGAAAALQDSMRRARVGRLVSRMLRPGSVERLFEVMDTIAAEAERRGLPTRSLIRNSLPTTRSVAAGRTRRDRVRRHDVR